MSAVLIQYFHSEKNTFFQKIARNYDSENYDYDLGKEFLKQLKDCPKSILFNDFKRPNPFNDKNQTTQNN